MVRTLRAGHQAAAADGRSRELARVPAAADPQSRWLQESKYDDIT